MCPRPARGSQCARKSPRRSRHTPSRICTRRSSSGSSAKGGVSSGARHESWKSRSPRLPVVFKAAVELAAAQGDDGVGSAYCPKHAGLFGTGTNDGFATRFNNTRPNEEVLLAELGITHPCSVPFKVVGCDADCLPQLWVAHL